MGKKEEEEEEHVRNIYDICLLTKEEDIKEEDKEEKRWCWGQKNSSLLSVFGVSVVGVRSRRGVFLFGGGGGDVHFYAPCFFQPSSFTSSSSNCTRATYSMSS